MILNPIVAVVETDYLAMRSLFQFIVMPYLHECPLNLGEEVAMFVLWLTTERNRVDNSICRATQLPDGMYAKVLLTDLLFHGMVLFWLQLVGMVRSFEF